MSNKITKAQEQFLITSMSKVAAKISAGDHPNNAIIAVVKSAQDKFTPEFIKRLIEATNINLTRSYMKQAAAEDRANDFDLANSESILSTLYPDKTQIVANEADAAKQAFLKQAYAPETKDYLADQILKPTYKLNSNNYATGNVAADILMNKVAAFIEDRKYILKTAKMEIVAKKSKLLDLIKSSGEYFRFAGTHKFTDVSSNILTTNPEMSELLNVIYKQANCAAFKVPMGKPLNTNVLSFNKEAAPYKSIYDAYKTAAELVTLQEDTEKLDNIIQQQCNEVREKALKIAQDNDIVDPATGNIRSENKYNLPVLSTLKIEPVPEHELEPEAPTEPGKAIIPAEIAVTPTPVEAPEKKPAPVKDYISSSGVKPKDKGNILGTVGKALGTISKDTIDDIKSIFKDKPSSAPGIDDRVQALGRLAKQETVLRSIVAENNLYRLLTEDNDIKSYNPQQVIAAFNELSQTSPRIVTDMNGLRAALRYKLSQGDNASLHDVEQLLKIDEGIRERDKIPPLDLWKAQPEHKEKIV